MKCTALHIACVQVRTSVAPLVPGQHAPGVDIPSLHGSEDQLRVVDEAKDDRDVVLRRMPARKINHLTSRPANNNRPPAINRGGLLCQIFTCGVTNNDMPWAGS